MRSFRDIHNRIFYYILQSDDGHAPCVENGLLTLAICKPMIRRTARIGDWIIGIAPKRFGSKLCYIAQITAKMCGCEYYQSSNFQKRGDVIYRIDKRGRYSLRVKGVHKSKHRSTDVGYPPDYPNTWVLISARRHFWYFGKNMVELSAKYPRLMAKISNLNQGHRVNHTPIVLYELERVISSIQKGYRPGKHGPARDAHDLAKCRSEC